MTYSGQGRQKASKWLRCFVLLVCLACLVGGCGETSSGGGDSEDSESSFASACQKRGGRVSGPEDCEVTYRGKAFLVPLEYDGTFDTEKANDNRISCRYAPPAPDNRSQFHPDTGIC